MKFEAATLGEANRVDSSARPSSREANSAPPAEWPSCKQMKLKQADRFSAYAFSIMCGPRFTRCFPRRDWSKSGKISPNRPDILQAEVEQQQANVSLRIAQQNLQASWRILAAVAGKPGLTVTRLEGDLGALPDLNYEEWLATTLRESPEVKLAQQAAERAEASLSQARKAVIPDLQITGILVQNYTT